MKINTIAIALKEKTATGRARCPECNGGFMQFKYGWFDESRVGYAVAKCDKCGNSFVVSRMIVPEDITENIAKSIA